MPEDRVTVRTACRRLVEGPHHLHRHSSVPSTYAKSTGVPSTSSMDPLSELPCFETFASRLRETEALEKFEQDVHVGDVLLVKVKRFDAVGAYVKPLCFAQRIKRDLEWLDMQLLTPVNPVQRRFNVGDKLLVDVVAVNPVKITIAEAPQSACIAPRYFSASRDADKTSFWKWLAHSKEPRNPYTESVLGLPLRTSHTFLPISGIDQDKSECASVLRRRQDQQLALDTVARGVHELRSGGGLASAVPLFNRAIDIFPNCAEAYIARGAAYANEEKFENAEMDLDKALQMDNAAKNAREYLAEVLLKHATSLLSEGQRAEAIEKLEKCLLVCDDDPRAKKKLEELGATRHQRGASVEVVEVTNSNQSKKRLSSVEGNQSEKDKKRREEEAKEEERRSNKEKLKEFERFIAAMKNA